MRQDVVLGAVTIVGCLGLYYETLDVQNLAFAAVGAQVWPRIVIGLIFLLAVLQIVSGIRRERPAQGETADDARLLERSIVPLAVFLAVGCFALAVPYIGFTVSGVIMVFGLLTSLGHLTVRAVIINAAIAFIAVVAMTIIFSQVMGIMLPQWRM